MIIVRFTSGLGNQMFQYNLYSSLRERFPEVPVKADLSWFPRFGEHQGYELERIFGSNGFFSIEEATDSELIRCSGRIPNRLSGGIGEVWQFILRIPHRLIRTFDRHERVRIDQTGFEDNAVIYKELESIDPAKDHYITGFFIEEVYYRDRLDHLKKVFRFDDALSESAKGYRDMIESGVSVSIHVRRGDYLDAKYSDSFRSLGQEYYRAAVAKARECFEDPTFYLFSDDPDYIEKAFGWLDKKVIVRGNSGKDSYRDMQLMSLCNGNITANSTFSLWAGLLNDHADKKVIYPSTYMKEKDFQVMTMPGWIRI